MLGRTVFVSDVMPPWATSVCTLVVTCYGARILHVADYEIVSCREQRAHAHALLALSCRVSVRRHRSVLVENSSRHIAGDPELTEYQGDRDGQASLMYE